jgi:Fe-S-cluster-containing hydrogenase component 2
MTRFDQMQRLLDDSKYFKLVCGAGNEDAEEVKRLTVLFTLAGAKGLDISANLDVVKKCVEGIELAFQLAIELNIPLKTRPWITVSVGMKGDNHVRKATINPLNCISCKLCIDSCPTEAIPNELIVNKTKCIGCGNCGAICPKDNVISYNHNSKVLKEILPQCLDLGVENFELHAAIASDDSIMEEWELMNEINKKGHNSMCLDGLHLSAFALEARIKKAKKIAGKRLIIQADGYPMSGGKDDYNTTLQAVAIADIINKRFNKSKDKKTKQSIYNNKQEVNVLLSGGTNSFTTDLADQCDVRWQGSSIGTFARNIVRDIIKQETFYNNHDIIFEGYKIAKNLVTSNIGEIYE